MANPNPKANKLVPKTPQEAALWLLARDEFQWWCGMNGFKWAKHHKILGQHLQKVATGEIRRLAVLMPRGSAKSTYSSRLFPGFYLGQNPSHCIIAASHTQLLADKHGRAARNYVSGKGPCIGVDIAPDSQAASHWATVQGGEYLGIGVGGSVVGSRGNCALLDDLIAGIEEADSDLFRDKVWEWLLFDLLPCLKPDARIVLVNNRWHEDDVAGRLFDPRNEHYNAEEAAKWTVLRMPLIAEDEDPLLGRKPGELLWPEYYNWDMVSDFKRDPRSFNAQYQQRPTSEEGGFFKREWLTGYTPSELPKDLRIYFASDHAVSTKQTADKTCLLVAGVCSQGYIWVLPETLWGRFTSEEVTEKAIDLIKLKNPLTWWAEKGHISQSIGPFLRRRMRERCVYTSIEEVTPAKDKQTRAQAIHGRMAMGMVRFPKFAPWWPDAEHELLSFPTGAHDDLCLAGNTRVRMADGTDSRLDQVKPGDFVATPFGPREVLAAEMTAPQADCLEVNFFDGRSLTGTHSHPILTENGFCRLDALACLDYCGCLYTLCKEAQAEQMLLNIEATDTAGIRIVSTRTIGATTTAPNPGEDSCTDMCGRTRTGRSPKGWTYTIRTAIQRTTTWEICRQFLDSITCFCTDLLSGPDQRHNSHILVESGKKPPSGTSRKLGASGTRPTENSRGLAGKSLWSPVWSAAKALRRFFRPGRSSVGRSVVTVPTVGVAFVRKARRQPVFNLRVDGHVFYANGILTHNCDALSWLGRGLETMVGPNGPVRRRDPGPKPFTGAWLNSIDERKRFKQMLEKSTAGW